MSPKAKKSAPQDTESQAPSAWWSLEMALHWIHTSGQGWRDPLEVESEMLEEWSSKNQQMYSYPVKPPSPRDLLHGVRNWSDVENYLDAQISLFFALTNGEVGGYASIDSGSVTRVEPSNWFNTHWTPVWHRRYGITNLGHEYLPSYFAITSKRPILPSGLLDHSEPAGVRLPSATNPDGEPGYFRVFRDLSFLDREIRKVWPFDKESQDCAPVTKRKRGLPLKLEKTLPTLSYEGLPLGMSKHHFTSAEIARLAQDTWEREGDFTSYEPRSVEQAVTRYYEDRRKEMNLE